MEEDQALLFFIPEFIGIPFREKSLAGAENNIPVCRSDDAVVLVIGKQPGPVMAV